MLGNGVMIFKKVMESSIAETVDGTKADSRMALKKVLGVIFGQTVLNSEETGWTIASRVTARTPLWMGGLTEVSGKTQRCMGEACTFGQMDVNTQAATKQTRSTA